MLLFSLRCVPVFVVLVLLIAQYSLDPLRMH
jgi:hypothetical protein